MRYRIFIIQKSIVCNTHVISLDVTMWLQHLVLVPQMCGDSRSHTTGALLADSVHGFVAIVLYFK